MLCPPAFQDGFDAPGGDDRMEKNKQVPTYLKIIIYWQCCNNNIEVLYFYSARIYQTRVLKALSIYKLSGG